MPKDLTPFRATRRAVTPSVKETSSIRCKRFSVKWVVGGAFANFFENVCLFFIFQNVRQKKGQHNNTAETETQLRTSIR